MTQSKVEQNAELARIREQPGHGGRTDAQRMQRLSEVLASANEVAKLSESLQTGPLAQMETDHAD
jgi:hypothetical protein